MKHKFFRNLVPMLLLFSFLLCACASRGDVHGPSPDVSPTQEPAVKKLILVQEPDKVEYVDGEVFDPTGVVLNAEMTDGTVLENVQYEGIIVSEPLEKTTLFAKFVYGGQTVQVQLRVFARGNDERYAVANTSEMEDSPLAGKVIFWLGSSVTEGASSGKESMVDFIAKKHGAQCIKEAVSGTTLVDLQDSSYVSRLNKYLASDQRVEHVDAFICQLSTNDRNMPEHFGIVTSADVRDPGDFDTTTTFGAMEYIIATAKSQWNCPIYFYTNPPFDDDNYGTMVDGLEEIAEKWDITIIDMYRDEAFNDISDDEFSLYMADSIHPTKAGYQEWWLPKFEEALSKI